jgi:hypothetical protein
VSQQQHATADPQDEVRRQLRRLRKALRTGDVLDALMAAAWVHAISVEPYLRCADWGRAQAECERLLSYLPARHSPAYQPRLRRVIEYLHADAAFAAHWGGDLDQAKQHLRDRIGYLRDRGAPAEEVIAARRDLAHVHLTAGEAHIAKLILADRLC